jgi:organic radical activating enzyme
MFGRNEIVGAKRFVGEPLETLVVTSVFYSLQGEGPFTGRPAVFIRLSHCQLACGFCDTFFDHGDRLSFDGLDDEVAMVCPDTFSPILVITGGEPMLQTNLAPYLKRQVANGVFNQIQIESNGLILRGLPPSVHLVVSPKCAEKHGKPTHYLQPGQGTLLRADSMKFVLNSDPASPYHEIPVWAFQWADITGRVLYASPMAEYRAYPDRSQELAKGDLKARSTGEKVSFWQPGLLDLDKVRRNHEHAARYCLRTGAFLTLQQQLFCNLP